MKLSTVRPNPCFTKDEAIALLIGLGDLRERIILEPDFEGEEYDD